MQVRWLVHTRAFLLFVTLAPCGCSEVLGVRVLRNEQASISIGKPTATDAGNAENAGSSAMACDGDACVALPIQGSAPVHLADIAEGDSDGFFIVGKPEIPIGMAVASGQDTNGDGASDILLGTYTQSGSGGAYLVWGHQRSGPLSVDDLVSLGRGYGVDGPSNQSTTFGVDVALVRDVNEDRRADMVVTSSTTRTSLVDPLPQDNVGFVLFGNNRNGTLIAPNSGEPGVGYPITGTTFTCYPGCVSGVGDQNGDGREDIAIPLFEDGGSPTKTLLVAFGQSGEAPVNGYRIIGRDINTVFHVVAGGDDINGDGRPDILIGAQRFRDDAYGAVVYVVFGPPAGVETISLSDVEVGQGGFVIHEARTNDFNSNLSIAIVGDLNDDGFRDILVGAPAAPADDHPSAGRAYVVFGKEDTAEVSLVTLENGRGRGFVINGADTSYQSGRAVAAIGDQNGDGIPDLLIGAPGADGDDIFAGMTYVVFGKRDTSPIALRQIQDGRGPGLAIVGAHEENSGMRVAAGDVNGDGVDDIVIGAPRGNAGGRVYVVFGGRR